MNWKIIERRPYWQVMRTVLLGGGYFVLVYLLGRFGLMGLNDPHKLRHIIPVFIWLVFFIPYKRTFFTVVLPISLIVLFFAPVTYIYGNIDYQALISVLATNGTEAIEFLQQVPIRDYLRGALVPFLAILSYIIARRLNIEPWRNKAAVFVAISALLICVNPTNFFRNFLLAYDETKENLEDLKVYTKKPNWRNVVSTTEEKDYVLIIGESARKDYFHAYGYPVMNTPFLDSVDGAMIVDGFTSGGVYTVGSLTNMLTDGDREKWKPRFDRNIIDLSNLANIKTYWLSNQGYISQFDTPITAIANRANDVVFLCKLKNAIKNESDYSLLPIFEKKLASEEKGKRLFVIHTIGSHPNVCQRVLDVKRRYKAKNSYFDYLACYLDSIKKTDRFIQQIYDILKSHNKNSGRQFSIIYISDHGQLHSESGGRIKLHNNSVSPLHYDVPLIKIDSEMQGRQYIKSKKSGLKFTTGLAQWLDIQADELEVYDLFDGVDDVDDYGLKDRIESLHKKPDHAMVFTLRN